MDADLSMFPIVVINLDACATVQSVLNIVEQHLSAGIPFVAIADGSRGVKLPLGAADRRVAGEFLREEKERMRAVCLGFCTVSSSPIVRGVITALNWISPMPVPHTVFATRAEAITWAQGLLGTRVSA